VPVVSGAGTRFVDGVRSAVGLLLREALSSPLATQLS